MDFIGKAFNPSQGNARAICLADDLWVMALITKGDDAEQVLAAFREADSRYEGNVWGKPQMLWENLGTESPVMLFCRNKRTNEAGIWRKCFYKNFKYEVGEYPDQPYALSSDMMGLYADFMLSSRELQMTTDFLRDDRFNFYSAREAMLLTTAPYVREKDAERFDKAIFEAFSALCGDHPEKQWEEAERVLREAIDPDAAYVLIVDADECQQRVNWSIKEGETTDERLRIHWSKKGWRLMNTEYDEHTDETVQAKTGSLHYEGFAGLCITEISPTKIVFRNGQEERILLPGETLNYHLNDSYEDHEGVEQYDVDYWLSISWVK